MGITSVMTDCGDGEIEIVDLGSGEILVTDNL